MSRKAEKEHPVLSSIVAPFLPLDSKGEKLPPKIEKIYTPPVFKVFSSNTS
jgi:hypothetical protein